ncbi:MAG: arginine--tRNA ligase [Nitrospirota bacterium]
MKRELEKDIKEALRITKEKGELKLDHIPPVILENPKRAEHGDFSTPIAMTLASQERMSPKDIAEIILNNITTDPEMVEDVKIALPGFINFKIKKSVWYEALKDVDRLDQDYGRDNIGNGEKVQVEFVSANPTGPIHVGHGRGAAVGDAIANLLSAVGYEVEREYYINDVGRQIETLGRSVYIRYLQMSGKDIPFPDECYQGDYIRDISKEIMDKEGDRFFSLPEDESLSFFSRYSYNKILYGIKDDCRRFGITFDNWFSERILHEDKEIENTLRELEEKGYLYKKDDALWFRTSLFVDDKDRVIARSNNRLTYFASDIAYHKNKFNRGFKRVIDIWGADHHGYIPRMKAAVKMLGMPPEALQILLVQLVNLKRGGRPVAMSTRAGEFVTLKEVIEEVGKDAARFFFLMRRCDSPLDFDLELAKEESSENPVYYVQYAHARLCSIIRQADTRRIDISRSNNVDLCLLSLPEELAIIKQIALYPEVIRLSSSLLEPHRLTFYLQTLASLLHNYYYKYRVISDDRQMTDVRLVLINAVRIVIRNTLKILGVNAPERM